MTDQVNRSSPVQKAMSDWLSYASRVSGFPLEKIKELLKEKFITFSIYKTGEMMTYLMNLVDHEYVESQLEKVAEKSKTPVCPICGAETIGDHRWDGRYTKTPGWRCTVGGLDHFLKAKANRICRLQGTPLVFKEKDGESISTDELDGRPERV